ncbi:MAG: flagellar hook-associated protein FlgK [Spirochaetaceae bacterium]|jgi:flagellar hook-associated protein 1 FlgK|nr:flagellar hook-associated protein FlgK [Spirochaetaceae bacterium]
MTSTFMGIELGKRGIMAHQSALSTTGHNIDNMNSEGYSRQRVRIGASEPIYMPGLTRGEQAGQLGQGSVAANVERVRDRLLDKRIVAQGSVGGYWETRDKYLFQMEQAYLEVGGSSVRGNMDAFWNAWQELSLHPTDNAARSSVLERGKSFVDSIHQRFTALKGLQDMAEEDITITVRQVNDLSSQIAALNKDISRIRAQGDNPNDLYDRRDLLVDKLSKLIDITVENRDGADGGNKEFMIHTAGFTLVQGNIGNQFDYVLGNQAEGYGKIVWQATGEDVSFQDGSLAALVEMRDTSIQEEIQTLDSMTMNFIDLVNEVHKTGYGANGKTGLDFFSQYPFVANVNGNYDRNGDGQFDSTYIYRMNGQNKLDLNAKPGLNGTLTLPAPAIAENPNATIDVPYYDTDSVQDIIDRINGSGAEVFARLNREGQLSIKGTTAQGSILPNGNPDFVIRSLADNGANGEAGLLLSDYTGILQRGATYNWQEADAINSLAASTRADGTGAEYYAVAPETHPAAWVAVNPQLVREPGSVAAGLGTNGRPANAGNGDAALAIAALRDSQVMISGVSGSNGYKTFDDYFAGAVGRIGSLGAQSKDALETQQLIMKQLTDLRSSISGVNLDEELAAMIQYQKGYEAAARFLTTANSLLDVLLGMVG